MGLRWLDVDLPGELVRFRGAVAVGPGGLVRKSLKGGRPKVVAVDPGTVEVLRAWRVRSAAEGLRCGVSGDGMPVLGSPSDPSQPWHPERLTREWVRHRDGIGLAGLRFHDLRHLHATHLLEAGVPVSTVSARLGHASARMTLEVYGHARPAVDRAAADVIGQETGATG